MLFSIIYLILRGLLRIVPSGEEGREREVEILVLRHQLKVLSRKLVIRAASWRRTMNPSVTAQIGRLKSTTSARSSLTKIAVVRCQR